jgi:hypothetical protein
MMLDSGTNLQLHKTDVESALHCAQPSKFTIEVANKQTMQGSLDGNLSMEVINTQGYAKIPYTTKITRPVLTVAEVGKEFFHR